MAETLVVMFDAVALGYDVYLATDELDELDPPMPGHDDTVKRVSTIEDVRLKAYLQGAYEMFTTVQSPPGGTCKYAISVPALRQNVASPVRNNELLQISIPLLFDQTA